MKIKTHNRLLVLLAAVCAITFTFAILSFCNTENRAYAETASATDFVDDTGYTTGNYMIVPDSLTTARIDVPTKLDELTEKTDVTATLTLKSVDFTAGSNDNPGSWYTNIPYVVFRESKDQSYQVWMRQTRNGMLQVFAGKIGSDESMINQTINFVSHMVQNDAWKIEIVSTATSADIFFYNLATGQKGSAVTVNYERTPVAFGVDFCNGYYGYLSDLSLKIDGTEYTDFGGKTRIDGFEISDRLVKTGGASGTYGELALNVPSVFFNNEGKLVKNLTTGEYVKISDLTLEFKYTAVDTATQTDNAHWITSMVWFWIDETGDWIGVRNGPNGINQLFSDRKYELGINNPGGVPHGYDANPYAFGGTIEIHNNKANVYLGHVDGRKLQYENYDLGNGTPAFYFGSHTTSEIDFIGISLRVKGTDEYDFNDVIDEKFLDLLNEAPENGAKLGEEELFAYNDGTYTYAGRKDAEGAVVDDCQNRVTLSDAFADESLKSTNLTTVISCTINMPEVPSAGWLVPGIAFWQDENGQEYDVQAYYSAQVFISHYDKDGTYQQTWVDQYWGIGTLTSYTLTVQLKNGVAKISYSNADGSLISEGTYNDLPSGKPTFKIFSRGTAATFSNVKMYTTEIIEDKEDGLQKFAVAMEAIEAPVAEKFGDELVGGKFCVTYSDGSTEEITRDNENLVVAAYNKDSLAEQTVIMRYTDEKSTLEYRATLTLVDYVTEVVVDWENEDALEFEFGAELSGYAVTAIYKSYDEKDVTSEVTINGYDASVAGEKSVTFTYDGVTSESYTVTVKEDVAVGIAVTMENTEFEFGAALSGYVVTLNKKSGAAQDITSEATVSGYNANQSGKQTVTFTYGDFSQTVDVTVKEKAVTPTPGDDPSNPVEEPSSGCGSSIGGVVGLLGVVLCGIAIFRIAAVAKKREND